MNAPPLLFSQRPLVWAACGFAAGIALATDADPQTTAMIAFGSLVVGFAALFVGRGLAMRPLGITLLLFAAGISWTLARATPPQDDPLFTRAWSKPTAEEVILEGHVAWPSLWNSADNHQTSEIVELIDATSNATTMQRARLQFMLVVDTLEADGQRYTLQSRSLVRWSDAQHALTHGERVRIRGKLYPTLSNMNPGISGAEAIYRLEGMHTLLRAQGAEAIHVTQQASPWSLPSWASRIREKEAEILTRIMPADILPFVFTVWLGERSGVSGEEMERFALAGTAHVLAVSGVHIAIVFVTVAAFTRRHARRRMRALFLLAFILLFVLLTGARTSVVRAAIMLSVYLIGELFNRDPDPPTSLAVAAIAILIHNPSALANPGFQMSFLSVASLLLLTPRIDHVLSVLPRPIRLSLSVTLAVQVLSLPAAAATFHVVPLLAPIVNLIVVPLLALLLALTMAATLLGAIATSVGTLLGAAVGLAVHAIESLTYGTASLVGNFAYWGPPSAIAIALYFITIWLALFMRRGGRYRYVGVTIAALATIVLWPRDNGDAFLAMLDVGHGDATVIRSPQGKTMLIDGGDHSQYGDMGQRVVAPFLRAHNIRQLDIVVATHGDRDHVGGLFYILDHWRVGEVWISAASKGSPLGNALIKKCAELDIPLRRIARGEDRDLGGAQLSVLHPPADWPAVYNENDNALVLRYTQDGTSTLLTADIEYAGEAAVRRGDCKADIMKAPHHGSNTSSDAAFIEAIAPTIAIASTGNRPGRDPVHAEVAARYEAAGIRLLRTDRSGGVIYRFFEGLWTLEAAREKRGWVP